MKTGPSTIWARRPSREFFRTCGVFLRRLAEQQDKALQLRKYAWWAAGQALRYERYLRRYVMQKQASDWLLPNLFREPDDEYDNQVHYQIKRLDACASSELLIVDAWL